MKAPAKPAAAARLTKLSLPPTAGAALKDNAAALPSADVEAPLLAPYPVLSSSQFCLELMTQGKALDLRQAAELLGRDPGAVLRVFAAVAQEFPNPADRPERLDECIMSLDSGDLIAALHTPVFSRREQVALVPFARHAHLISRYSIVVAASLGLNQEGAQMVGLLHALEVLPAALGRGPVPPDIQTACALSAAISKRYHLPADIARAIHAVGRRDPASIWVAMIEAAHDLATSAGSLGEAGGQTTQGDRRLRVG